MLASLVVLALLAAALLAHAVLLAPRRLEATEVEVPIADLPAALEGWTAAVVADVHQLPPLIRPQLAAAVAAVRAARPDAVLLLGDYGPSFSSTPRLTAWLYHRGMRATGDLFRALAAPDVAPDGAFAVLGNHDYYLDGEVVARWLEGLGVHVLRNASVIVQRATGGAGGAGAALVIGGTDDLDGATVDPAGGCAARPDAPTIVLAHHPDSVFRLTSDRRIDLVLSGHTHGGQVVLPWYGAPLRLSRVCSRHAASGWVPNGRARLYVSRGLGGDIPLRVNCAPELVFVRLTRGSGAGRVVRRWRVR